MVEEDDMLQNGHLTHELHLLGLLGVGEVLTLLVTLEILRHLAQAALDHVNTLKGFTHLELFFCHFDKRIK